jgi:hypothetical protein
MRKSKYWSWGETFWFRSLSNFLLTIKLNYLHDLKIMFQCLLHLITYIIEITPNLHVYIIGTCKDMPHYDPKVFYVMHYFWSIICPLEVRCLTPLSKIFQLSYHIFYWNNAEFACVIKA